MYKRDQSTFYPLLLLVALTPAYACGDTGGGTGGGSMGSECSFGDECGGGKCTVANLEQTQPRCRPNDPNPKEVGDSCEKTINGQSDDCREGALCVNGSCVDLCPENSCGGSPFGDSCYVLPSGTPLCTRTCDPLLDDCFDLWQCVDDASIPTNRFVCAPKTTDERGNVVDNRRPGDECSTSIQCRPGSACMAANTQGGRCDGILRCCAFLCEEGDPSFSCPDSLSCLSAFAGGVPPPGVDPDLGVCASSF